jgi:hypothetical protein
MDRKEHYHLFMGSAGCAPLQNTTFDDYSNSVRGFVHLCKQLYVDWDMGTNTINYENALVATGFGQGESVLVGSNILCVQWTKCSYPCLSPSWN